MSHNTHLTVNRPERSPRRDACVSAGCVLQDVKVFGEDATCKVVEIMVDMTARDLCQLLVYRSHCVDDNSWTLVEHHPHLGLGREHAGVLCVCSGADCPPPVCPPLLFPKPPLPPPARSPVLSGSCPWSVQAVTPRGSDAVSWLQRAWSWPWCPAARRSGVRASLQRAAHALPAPRTRGDPVRAQLRRGAAPRCLPELPSVSTGLVNVCVCVAVQRARNVWRRDLRNFLGFCHLDFLLLLSVFLLRWSMSA